MSEGVYTDDSMDALKKALADAKAVMGNMDAGQDEVDAQRAQLQAAIDSLVKRTGEEDKNPDDSSAGKDDDHTPDSNAGEGSYHPSGNNAAVNKDQAGKNKAHTDPKPQKTSGLKSVQTGDGSEPVVFCILCVISMILICKMVRYKRKAK